MITAAQHAWALAVGVMHGELIVLAFAAEGALSLCRLVFLED